MDASEARESGSDSEWAIVDEAPSLQEANEDPKYVFRGDGSRVAGNQGTGEVSDGESIEIVPDDRDVEALEAIAEPREQEQPLNLDRVEEISPPVDSTSTANLFQDASDSRSGVGPRARLSDRDHWDFVAILLVALVGGFTVGFFCGSTGVIPSQPSPVSEDVVGGLHLEIHLLQTAFKALQAATIAAEDSRDPPLAAATTGERPVPADMGQLYADFVSFQCRWRNNCRLGNAFCFARMAEPEFGDAEGTPANLEARSESTKDRMSALFGNSEERSVLTEAEKAWGLTAGDLEEQEGWYTDCLDDLGEGSEGEAASDAVNSGSEVEAANEDGDKFRMEPDVTSENFLEGTSQTPVPLPLKFVSVISPGYISTEGDLKLWAEAASKVSAESDSKVSADFKQWKQLESLEALTRLAALLAPSANMTALTQALTLSVHMKTGPEDFHMEAEFASLAERRVAKLAQRLESLRQRAAEKAGRAIARAQSDLAVARARMCAKKGEGPLCPGNKPGPKQGPAESAGKHFKKDKKQEDMKTGEQKEKTKEWAKKEFSKTGKKFDKEGGKKRASEASSKAERNDEKHVKEDPKRENSKPKGETNRNKGHPKSTENKKEWKEKTAKKLPKVETKEGRSKKLEKTDKVLQTEDAEKYRRQEKESEKSFQKKRMDEKKFSKTWTKEDAEKHTQKDKESEKNFEKERKDGKKFSKTWSKEDADKPRNRNKESGKNFQKERMDDKKFSKMHTKENGEKYKERTDEKQSAKTLGKGKRGDEGEWKKDRKVREEARKVGKQGDKKDRSEGCDWSDCEDRPPHRATKPKGDSGPRRAFDWPTPCESLATDWPADTEACQSVDAAKNVSWVFARGCGREASRTSQAQSDWLFDRAAARKQSRDVPSVPSEREKPKRSGKPGCTDCENPEKASSKFAKRWLPERMVAAGRKMREAFHGMKQRAMKWR